MHTDKGLYNIKYFAIDGFQFPLWGLYLVTWEFLRPPRQASINLRCANWTHLLSSLVKYRIYLIWNTLCIEWDILVHSGIITRASGYYLLSTTRLFVQKLERKQQILHFWTWCCEFTILCERCTHCKFSRRIRLQSGTSFEIPRVPVRIALRYIWIIVLVHNTGLVASGIK